MTRMHVCPQPQSLKNSVAAIFTSEATYLAQVICLSG